MDERWAELNEEAKKTIVEELGAIKLKQGNCIVCNNSIISDDTIERIMTILKENNVSGKTQKEYKKLFGVNL